MLKLTVKAEFVGRFSQERNDFLKSGNYGRLKRPALEKQCGLSDFDRKQQCNIQKGNKQPFTHIINDENEFLKSVLQHRNTSLVN